MNSKLLAAAVIAALAIGTGAAQAQPGHTADLALAPSGVAVEQAKVSFHFRFGYPYYYQPYYYQPYYAPPAYQGPYQYCHLGVCY